MASVVTTDILERAIRAAIDSEIDRAVTDAVEQAHKQVRERIPEIVAGVTLKVHKMFSMQRMGDEMVIHVRIEG